MYELTAHRSLPPVVAFHRAPRVVSCPAAEGRPGSRHGAACVSVRGRRQVSAAAPALDGGTEAATAPVQPLHSAAQLRKATAVLQNAITTAVVDFSRRDEPQASASTQFVIVTEQMPLDRAAAEGWLQKLVPPAELADLLALHSLLALTITDAAKVLIVCPSLRNLSRQELCGRMMALRVALPAADVAAIIRKRPQLLLDQGHDLRDAAPQDAASKAERALRRLKALMPAYDVERLISDGGETWYNFANML